MRFLAAIVDALVAFVRRNPLFVLCVVALALAALDFRTNALPLLRMVLGTIVSSLIMVFIARKLLARWILRMNTRQQNRAFWQGFGNDFRQRREGDVRVYKTTSAPEKRISRDVGDYVEFEETKNQ